MSRSLTIWLHLLLRRGDAREASGLLPAPIVRPEGKLIWLHLAASDALPAAQYLVRQMVRAQPGVTVLVTGAPEGAEFAAGVQRAPAPADRIAAARVALAAWRPDLLVHVGLPQAGAMPVALIAEAAARGLPQMLIEARIAAGGRVAGPWGRAVLRALLTKFATVLVPDQVSAAQMRRLGVALERMSVVGGLREPVAPLPCTEAERAALAEQLHSRPVWFAVAVPEAEEAALLEAHDMALMRAHRLLLVLMPEAAGRAEAIAEAVEARGQHVAWRALEQEPDDDVQVLIVEDEAELGLWYRLAPVTWMGGTHCGAGSARSPLEPAALGSAIVHGPATGQYAAEYARLSEAGACRVATTPIAMAEVVADLIAPDRVAALAHAAWVVISADAGVAEQVAQRVLAALDAAGAG